MKQGGTSPTEPQVKNYIAKINPEVNLSYISVNGITNKLAIVTGLPEIYFGSVQVTFTIVQLVDLNEVLTQTNLGTIFTSDTKPNVNQIKTALKSDNINLDLNINAINVENITATSATIVGDELKYTGTINVSFIVKKVEDLLTWRYGPIKAVTVNANGIFVGTSNTDYTGKIFKSDDEGNSFTELRGTVGQIVSLVSDNNGNVYAATRVKTSLAYKGNVYASDGSSSFGIVPGIPDEAFIDRWPQYLNIDTQGNIYVAVTYFGTLFDYAEIYKSVGTSGFRIVAEKFASGNYAMSVAVDQNGTIFVGTRSKSTDGRGELYKSVNGGNFTKVSGITAEVYSLVCDSVGTIFVGLRTGDGSGSTYIGNNNNTSFTPISGTIGSVYMLQADIYGNVYAGTRSGAGLGALYKSSGRSDFSVISGTVGSIYGIGIDEVNKTFYAGSTQGTSGYLYKGIQS